MIAVVNLISVAQILKFACAVCGTAHAVLIMVAENEFEHFPSVLYKCVRLGCDHHTVLDLCTARGKQIVISLDLHHAQAA